MRSRRFHKYISKNYYHQYDPYKNDNEYTNRHNKGNYHYGLYQNQPLYTLQGLKKAYMDTKGTSLSELKIKTPLNHHAKNYDFPPQYKGVQNEKFSNHKYPNMNVNNMNVNHPGVVGNHVGLNVLGVDGFDEGNNGRYSNMGKNEPNTFDNSHGG